ncbi:MAG: YfhO family protein, partial [Candidatus Omnitrophota bacterium]|nr:YfhO family protein [Candidatus Omnitrophota bacterium]
IDARKGGILVDFESWHRHWQLKVNDKNKKLYKAFRAFKGIKIEPGINRIKLSYSLEYFKELFFLSIFVIFVYITLLVSSYRKKLINT